MQGVAVLVLQLVVGLSLVVGILGGEGVGASGEPRYTRPQASVQKLAPHFSAEALVDGQFKTVALSDYAGKYLVLFFYPLDFTFVCPTELTTLSDRIAEFHALNTEVVAISVDSKYSHLAWTKTPREEGGLGTMNIPIIADITKKMSRDYGVLLEDGPDEGVALRAMFIINEEGKIRHITMNDLPVGRNVDETLRLIKAFQYTDTHDEVCPMNWQPGARTMTPLPDKAQEYFQTLKGNVL